MKRILLAAVTALSGGLLVPSLASAAPTTFSYTGPPVPIPDAGQASVLIDVSGLRTISDVNFRIDGAACSTNAGSSTVGIDHTFAGDVEVELTSPAGTTVTAIWRGGGSGAKLLSGAARRRRHGRPVDSDCQSRGRAVHGDMAACRAVVGV